MLISVSKNRGALQTFTVQYFERAVFESHPENKPPYDVLLSLLGTYRFHSQYSHGDPAEPYTENFPRYPGAQQLEVKDYEDTFHPNVVLTYIAPASPNEVLVFYKDVLGKDGWETPPYYTRIPTVSISLIPLRFSRHRRTNYQ